MLKTYRIIPLIFILFLFGFTLITVSPVLALSVASRINALEDALCNLHPELEAAFCVAIEEEKQEMEKFKERLRQRCAREPDNPECREEEQKRGRERTKSWDKDPFTYGPDGSARQSPDGKFRCIGFPKVRSWPECEKKFKEAKERTKRLFQSETGVRFPDK